MKQLNCLFAALAALAVLACNKIENPSTPSGDCGCGNKVEVSTDSFEASLEPESRTTLSGLKVLWAAGDAISVNGKKYLTESEGETASFTPESEAAEPAEGTPLFKAFYPASVGINGALPERITHVPETLKANPMYACSNDNNLSFKNLCGLFHIVRKGTSKLWHITVSDAEKNLTAVKRERAAEKIKHCRLSASV